VIYILDTKSQFNELVDSRAMLKLYPQGAKAPRTPLLTSRSTHAVQKVHVLSWRDTANIVRDAKLCRRHPLALWHFSSLRADADPQQANAQRLSVF
jgi:hypothetical protein